MCTREREANVRPKRVTLGEVRSSLFNLSIVNTKWDQLWRFLIRGISTILAAFFSAFQKFACTKVNKVKIEIIE